MNYLSPCGRGRPEGAGEGYFRIALVLKRFQKAYDDHPTRVLEKDGFKVIRFWNNDVLSDLERVLKTILDTPHPPLRDDLSHKGRGKRA